MPVDRVKWHEYSLVDSSTFHNIWRVARDITLLYSAPERPVRLGLGGHRSTLTDDGKTSESIVPSYTEVMGSNPIGRILGKGDKSTILT